MLEKIKPAIWGAFLLISLIIAIIQPPFQTPDEFDHLKRSYLLSKGEIFLRSENGTTGGYIDSGLLKFMSNFNSLPFHYEAKFSGDIKENSSHIKWSTETQFSGLPNTAVYFPAIYTPQAFFIALSELLGLKIYDSYIFVKCGCIIVTFLLFFAANKVLKISDLSMSFLIMPMALSLIGSTHPEPFSYGLVMIAAAVFTRSLITSANVDIKSSLTLAIILFVLTTYRINLLPIFLLPLALAWKKRDTNLALLTAVSIIFALSWIIYASQSVVGFRIDANTTADTVTNYSVNLMRVLTLLFGTIFNFELVSSYLFSFIGVIGWLDTSLTSSQYITIEFLLLTILILSIKLKGIKNYLNFRNAIIFFSTISSIILLFLILIFTVTKPSSNFIIGVQGRYFIPIALLFSYLFALPPNLGNTLRSYFLIGLLILSSVFTVDAINKRYYLSSYWNNNTFVVGNIDANDNFGPLTSGRTFEQPFLASGAHLEAVRLKLATFKQVNSGLLFFEILNSNGQLLYKSEYNLSDIRDNDWFIFEINGLTLIKGEEYKIKLSAMPYNVHSITWWASTNHKSEGVIAIDGKKRSGTFVYQLLFRVDPI